MVIRYYSYHSEVTDTVKPVWEEIVDKSLKGRVLDRKEAKKIIKDNGYVLVFSNQYGQIFDTPSEEFKQNFIRSRIHILS